GPDRVPIGDDRGVGRYRTPLTRDGDQERGVKRQRPCKDEHSEKQADHQDQAVQRDASSPRRRHHHRLIRRYRRTPAGFDQELPPMSERRWRPDKGSCARPRSYSTVTLFARFRGLSIGQSRIRAASYAKSCRATLTGTGEKIQGIDGISMTSSTNFGSPLSPSVPIARTGEPRALTSPTFERIFS